MKYTEHLNRIDDKTLYKGLLAYGLFADKIPPFLSSKSFYDYCQNNDVTYFPKKPANYIYYESLRSINVPRPFGIPNPVAYKNLCKVLSDNWTNIKEHFRRCTQGQSYKVSRIHIRKIKGKNYLFEMNYNNFKEDASPEPDLLIGKKFVVKADISNFFPSIYTHSIPWALIGKDNAKRKRKGTLWYNQIDEFTRNIKDAETHGILIGPHASNLISEIILVAVDKIMYEKGYRYLRFIDDYTCYVETYEEANKFLVDLTRQLRFYDLTLNHRKTEILELPVVTTKNWVREIKAFRFFNGYHKVKYNELSAYFDLAIELMSFNENDAAILKYAIKFLSKQELTENAKVYYIKKIRQLVVLYPYLLQILEEYVFVPFKVINEIIGDIANDVFTNSLKSNNYEAMCYAIYFAIKYKFNISDLSFECVEKSNNCILLLLSYLYHEKRKLKEEVKRHKKLAEEMLEAENDLLTNWLFVYEVLPQSKLKDYWKRIKKAGVTFVDFGDEVI